MLGPSEIHTGSHSNELPVWISSDPVILASPLHVTVMTTFPPECPASTYCSAAAVSTSG